MEGTAGETGEAFFRSLVRNLAEALGTFGAWVTDYLPEARRLRARAFWLGGRFVEHYEYDLAGTPCERVIDRCRLLHIPDRVVELFPGDPDLKPFGAVSYTGMPFTDDRGRILGHLAVLDTKPLQDTSDYLAIFRIFAARAAAELRRLQAEATLRERETRLKRLIDGALDGIIDFDAELRVRLLNPAAAMALGVVPGETLDQRLDAWVSQASARKLGTAIAAFDAVPDDARRSWIAGGLEARRASGETFAIEATLSQTSSALPACYTLIFRDGKQPLDGSRSQSLHHPGLLRRLPGAADPPRPYVLDNGEPAVLLGNESGVNPVEYVLNALAGCLTTTMVYHAAARGIANEAVESELEGDIDIRGFLGLSNEVRKGYHDVRVRMRVKSAAGPETLAQLAKFSPVYDIVSNSLPVEVMVETYQD